MEGPAVHVNHQWAFGGGSGFFGVVPWAAETDSKSFYISKVRSHCVVQAGLELLGSNHLSTLTSYRHMPPYWASALCRLSSATPLPDGVLRFMVHLTS